MLEHEPELALFVPDSDPLRFYASLLAYAAEHLASGGMLFFEINPLVADRFAPLAKDNGFDNVEIMADLHGRRRFVIISRR